MGTQEKTSRLTAALTLWSFWFWERAATSLRWLSPFVPFLIPLYLWSLKQFAYSLLEMADVNFGDEDDKVDDKLRTNARKLLKSLGVKP